MIFKTKFLLIAILVLAAALRFWGLGSNPPSPDWDEAALGYNAYSIFHTGKDEYGQSFPIILRSFGDYKPALYVYLAMPSIAVFGLNVFAVRLPSALFGLLTVLAVYFLVKELMGRKSSIAIPLMSTFILAISPWHIQFSRVAFESNIGVTFSVFAALFFLYGLRKNFMLYFSVIFLALGFYAYQSEKVFFPLFAIILVAVFWKKLLLVKRRVLISAVILGVLIALPMVSAIFSDSNTLERAKNVSIFNQQSDDYKINAVKLILDHQTNDALGLILDNRRVLFAKQIIENYLAHFDLNWLFIKGDIGRHHAPGMGLLYLAEMPFFFAGIYFLLFGPFPRKMKLLLFLWLLAAPIPASLTTGVPHAVRAFHMIPVVNILTAIGVVFVMGQVMKIKKKFFNIQFKDAAFALILLFFIFNFCYYINQYFVQLPYFESENWQYGYEQAVGKIQKLSGQYDKIVVSNNGYLDQSYIFFLFYLRYDPAGYQSQMSFIDDNDKDRKFGKYEFRHIDWEKEKAVKNVLYVGMPDEFPDDYAKKATIDFIDGKPAIEIAGT